MENNLLEKMPIKKKSPLRMIAGWVIYLAILAVLVWGVPKALSYELKTPYPMASITSGSMWPNLKQGDMVFIKGVSSKDEINVGDIVVYKNPMGFTIHRVIQKNASTIITKGDANNVDDAPVKYEDLVGKTLTYRGNTLRIPYLGQISAMFKK
jgi:signal peptidase